jgi:molybdate transport system ATP-binding protein
MSEPASGLSARVEVTRGGFTLDVDIQIPPGQIVSVLGPNGAGKSTLLAVLAGLLPVGSGQVRLDELVMDDPVSGVFRRPEDRPVGVVFQDYRLFPRQSVLENVAFGPRSRGTARPAARARALGWLTDLGIAELAGRRPKALSGGQAQRVALARALATEPALLLLDEPLAALDAQTRREVQQTLRAHLNRFAGPVVIVTHDPVDAVLLAERLIVLEAGRVRQDAAPDEVLTRPSTPYVAHLLDLNLLHGRVANGRLAVDGGGALETTGIADADDVLAVIRPSAITVHRERPNSISARNVWAARITALTRLPDRVRISTVGPPTTAADVTPAAVAELALTEGQTVFLSAKASDIHTYRPD